MYSKMVLFSDLPGKGVSFLNMFNFILRIFVSSSWSLLTEVCKNEV
jgi:hypothetical protein